MFHGQNKAGAALSFALIFGLTAALAACNMLHIGQRVLDVHIEVDGKVVCKGFKSVPDHTPVSKMWDALEGLLFEAVEDNPLMIRKDPNAQTRILEGQIVVRLLHVDQELRRAQLKKLTLKPADGGAFWSIDPAEIERIKQNMVVVQE